MLTEIIKKFSCNVDLVTIKPNQNAIVAAYNRYEADNRDYTDYLYDITNNEDVKSCLDGGVTFGELAEVYYRNKSGHATKYYTLDRDGKPKSVETDNAIFTLFADKADEIISEMVVFPYIDGYTELYKCFINAFENI